MSAYKISGFFLLFFAASAQAETVDIAAVECNAKSNTFSIRYVVEKDDFYTEPKLPASCRLGSNHYVVSGRRGVFGMSRCGAQPPVSIDVKRNKTLLVSHVVLGDNCFGGPSLASLSTTKDPKGMDLLEICVYPEPTLANIEPQPTPICVSQPGKNLRMPITQATIDEIAAKAKTEH